MISRSLAIARIVVPSLVNLRNAPVPIVITIPAAIEMTWVVVTVDLADHEAVVVGRQQDRARRAAARRPQQVHRAEQDQRQTERGRRLDERLTRGQRRAEHHPVGQRDHRGDHDRDEVREPDVPVRLRQLPRDQGAEGTDRSEREVQHSRRPVQDHHPDARQGVHGTEREPGDEERLEVLPAREQ